MQDRYGRIIEYMRVSVTDRCNLRCVYCMPREGVPGVAHSDILTFDEIERVCRIGTTLGITRIKLTGGEPLVRRNLPDLAGRLTAVPGIDQVTLTTNGTLLKDNINALVSGGMKYINISIDTLDKERYREITRGGSLEDALDGLRAALSFPELTVKINCVPLEGQRAEEWIRLASIARGSRVEVRFIEMMPVGLGRQFSGQTQEKVLSVLREKFGEPERYQRRLGNGPAVYVHFPGFCGRVGFISAVSHRFCGSCNRIRLTATGCLKPCLQYGGGADLRGLMRQGAGDDEIREAMYKTIYNKPAGHHFEEQNIREDEEGKFEMKEMSRIGG